MRARVRNQGLVALPSTVTEASTRLVWLVNMDFGGFVPSTFTRSGLLNTMFYPRAKVIEMEHGLSEAQIGRKGGDGGDNNNSGGGGGGVGGNDSNEKDEEQEKGDNFIVDIPTALGLEDCRIAEFQNKTMDEQRRFFVKRMQEMARAGHDEEDGWTVSSFQARLPESTLSVNSRRFSRMNERTTSLESLLNLPHEFWNDLSLYIYMYHVYIYLSISISLPPYLSLSLSLSLHISFSPPLFLSFCL